MPFRTFLAELHRLVAPEVYVEIGVRGGHSLSLARGRAVGIDPNFAVTEPLSAWSRLIPMTSAAFFAEHDLAAVMGAPRFDLALIDGMHLFENALEDFINLERFAGPCSMIVLDDVLPRTAEEAQRHKSTPVWTGDVWKILPCLSQERPDLKLLPVATFPTGVLLAVNLDPTSRQLAERYDALVSAFVGTGADIPPPPDLITQFYDPAALLQAPAFLALMAELRNARGQKTATPGQTIPGFPGPASV